MALSYDEVIGAIVSAASLRQEEAA